MIVYIEQVILDNLAINYFLLWFVSLVLKEKENWVRFLLASAVGTIFAVIFPLFEINQILFIFFKTILGFLIILVAFPYKNIKNLLVLYTSFLIFTFLFGGVVFGLLLNILEDYTVTQGTFSYVSKTPLWVYIMFGFFVFKLLHSIIFLSKNKQKLDEITFELNIFYLEKITKIKAFLDTGNLLLDKETNLPIIVINFKAFKEITHIKTEQFLLGEYNLQKARYQTFFTANKSSKMLLFEVSKICFKYQDEIRVIHNAVLGLAVNNFSLKLNCDALIGINLIEREGKI